MMRVCFIITKSIVGGAQKWVKDQVSILEEDFTTFVVTNKSGWLTEELSVSNILLDERIEKTLSLKFLFRLASYIKDNEIDIIVASSANAGVYARLIKLLCKVKVVYVSHGWSALYRGSVFRMIFSKIELFLSYFTDKIICVSNSDYNNAKNIIGIEDNKLELIENKIFPNKHRNSSGNSQEIRILTVARLDMPKRVDLLLLAMRDIKATLFIVGDGPQRNQLEKLAKDNSLENVKFLGEIKGFKDFSDYDIFVLVSDSEGLPMSALEALSANLPIVLSDVGGCSDLIDGNGVLVSNDIQSIIKGITEVIENYTIMSQNSEIIYNKKFNLALNKYDYIKFYMSLI